NVSNLLVISRVLYPCKLSLYEASQSILLLRYVTYILSPLCNYFVKDFRHKALTCYLFSSLSDLHYSFYILSFVLYL
ncbi:hypothetical protein J3R30DRAFT_3486062, partial [Lentinula aciculospora]